MSGAPETRDAAAYRECTRDPIFVFQARRWRVMGAPSGYEFDDEGDCVEEVDPIHWTYGTERKALSPEQLSHYTFGEFDTPCAIETWETERVYLTREEAESYGKARAYNYRDGWRVYCVTAEGALRDLLKRYGETVWPHAKAPLPRQAVRGEVPHEPRGGP